MQETPMDGPFTFPETTWVIVSAKIFVETDNLLKALTSARLMTGTPFIPAFTSLENADVFINEMRFKGHVPHPITNRDDLRRILDICNADGVPYVGIDFRKRKGGICAIADLRWS